MIIQKIRLLTLILFCHYTAFSQIIDPNFSASIRSIGQPVDILELADGSLVFGGSFTFANDIRTNFILKVNAAGERDQEFFSGTGFNGAVTQMELTVDGKILIAGNFTDYNGYSCKNLIRLLPDGVPDESFQTGSGFNGFIRQFAQLEDGSIILIGGFTTYRDIPVQHIARLLPDGSLDATFNTGGSGLLSIPRSIHSQGGNKVILNHFKFSTYNGENRMIFRINADGSIDDSFTFTPETNQLGAQYMAISPMGKIGFIDQSGLRKFIYLSEDGNKEDEIDLGFSGDYFINIQVDAAEGFFLTLTRPSPTFDHYQDLGQVYRYEFNQGFRFVAGNTHSTFFQILKVLQNGDIMFWASFTGTPSYQLPFVTKLDAMGKWIDDFVIRFEIPGGIETIIREPDGKILIGGRFQRINGILTSDFTRLDQDGQIDPDFTFSWPQGIKFAGDLAVQPDEKILITTEDKWTGRSFVNRLHTDGTNDESFRFAIDELNVIGDVVTKIVPIQDGRIGLVGAYNAATEDREGIIWLRSDGTIDESFSYGFKSNYISDVFPLSDHQMIITGDQISYTGSAPVSVLKIGANDQLAPDFASVKLNDDERGGFINAIDLEADGSILLGGYFNYLNDQSVPSAFLQLNPDGTLKENSGIDQGFMLSDEVRGRVNDLEVLESGDILVCGVFLYYNNLPVSELVVLDQNKQLIQSIPFFGGGLIYNLYEITETEEGVYIGGRFLTEAESLASSLTRLNPILFPISTQDIKEITFDLFTLYPNVVRDEIRFRLHPEFGRLAHETVLFDAHGKVLTRWKDLESEKAIRLPGYLAAGTYFIQLSVGKVRQIRRFIKL